jgi:PAS domain S-box-containing protein
VYINLIDKIAIISKTDLKGNITFVNDIFCEISGYEKDELIGKSHNIVRHPEVPNRTYQNMWDTIKKGEIWKGSIKNLTKTKEDYSVNATIFPIIDDETELVNGYMAVRFLTTDEELKRRAFKSQVMQQVVEFRTMKAGLEDKISALEGENFKLRNTDFIEDKLKQEFDKNKKLNNQLSLYENNLKTNKEIYEKQLFEIRDRFVEMEKENRRMKNYIQINKNETNEKETVISDLTKQIAEIGKYEKKLLHRISELEDVIKHG